MKDYKKFKVGMKVKILGNSSEWNSELNSNCPFKININDFPYYCIIKDISIGITSSVAMTEGKYGWSLSSLIDSNLIFSIKEERKQKLEILEKI